MTGDQMTSLPPGQRARSDFPRFGLTPYAFRFPKILDALELTVSGDAVDEAIITEPLVGLSRMSQVCDFHCVTTWSHQNVHWEGVRFAEFYERRIAPKLKVGLSVQTVVLRGQDGYRTSLPLADLLANDVLIVERLDGVPLSIEHGAPLRIVAPAHYGYKSVKHLSRIEFWQKTPPLKPAAFAFMDHPRARVAREERGRWLPGWLLRLAYRPLIRRTAELFQKAMDQRDNSSK